MTVTVFRRAARSAGWLTPWRCSVCWRNHPGPCGCPCHFPAQVRARALAAPVAGGGR